MATQSVQGGVLHLHMAGGVTAPSPLIGSFPLAHLN